MGGAPVVRPQSSALSDAAQASDHFQRPGFPAVPRVRQSPDAASVAGGRQSSLGANDLTKARETLLDVPGGRFGLDVCPVHIRAPSQVDHILLVDGPIRDELENDQVLNCRDRKGQHRSADCSLKQALLEGSLRDEKVDDDVGYGMLELKKVRPIRFSRILVSSDSKS